ncbi:MAG: ribonuclease P protein component [Firmicutes bacterium]|nr:ribonuclease P protein component [Bacillota bacterium]
MLKRKYRLTKYGSFNYLYKRGAKQGNGYIKLHYIKSNATKIGFSVSKKVGNAVVRNLVKRRLRNILFVLQKEFAINVQLVVVAFPSIVDLDFLQLFETVKQQLYNSNILISKK